MECGVEQTCDAEPSSSLSTPPTAARERHSTALTNGLHESVGGQDDDHGGVYSADMASVGPINASLPNPSPKLDAMKKEPRAKMSMSPNKPGGTHSSPGTRTNRKSLASTALHRTNSPRDTEDLAKAVRLKNASAVIDGFLTPAEELSDSQDDAALLNGDAVFLQNGKENSAPDDKVSELTSTAEELTESKVVDNNNKSEDIARFLSNARRSMSPSFLEDPSPRPTSKPLPRARKSLPSSSRSSPAKTTPSEESSASSKEVSSTHVTLRLKEIERTLGIKSQTLSKIDAKTLDKLILEKAKPKSRSTSTPPRELGETKVSASVGRCSQDAQDPSQQAPPALSQDFNCDDASIATEMENGTGANAKKKRRKKGGTYTLPGCKKNMKRLQHPAGLKRKVGRPRKNPLATVQEDPANLLSALKQDACEINEGKDKSKPVGKPRKKRVSKKFSLKQKKAALLSQDSTATTVPVLGPPLLYDDNPAYHDTTESEYSADEGSCKPMAKPVVADSPTPMDNDLAVSPYSEETSPKQKDTTSVSLLPTTSSSSTIPSSSLDPSEQQGPETLPIKSDSLAKKSPTKKRRKKKGTKLWSKPKGGLGRGKAKQQTLTGPLPNLLRKRFAQLAKARQVAAADEQVLSTSFDFPDSPAPVDAGKKEEAAAAVSGSAGEALTTKSVAIVEPSSPKTADNQTPESIPIKRPSPVLTDKESAKSRRGVRKRKVNAKRKRAEKAAIAGNALLSPEAASSPVLSPIKNELPERTHSPSPNPPVISPMPALLGSASSVDKPELEGIRGQKLDLSVEPSPIAKLTGANLARRAAGQSDSESEEPDHSQDSEEAYMCLSRAKQPKYVNTPNGVSYPVTPPKTPENAGSIARDIKMRRLSPTDKDFMPLCCCKVNGTSFLNGTQIIYCQALDSIDGKVVGCCNRVTNSQLVRSAIKIPFMAVCEVHRFRLRQHQCCPGCGHFCSQGKFLQCKKDGKALHHFHIQCQIFKGDKHYCPHCGEESSQIEVLLKMNEPRASSFIDQRERKVSLKPRAKMSVGSTSRPKKALSSMADQIADRESMSDTVTAHLVSGAKNLSPEKLAMGPTREELTNALAIIHSEKPKKMRTGPKNLYHAAKSQELEKLLCILADGVDPNQRFDDQNNETALHVASEKGNTIFVHILLQAGGMPNLMDNDLRTPLMAASDQGHLEVMRILIRAGAVVDSKGEDGMTSLHLAAKAGHVDAFKYLVQTHNVDINCKDDGGWTPIIWAAEHGHLEIVKFILTSGGDPNIRDNEENTGLHWAAYAGSIDIAELFINAGCNIESTNERGDRALHIAARQDNYECVVLFLARGADSEARNNENDAPISCCSDQNTPVWMALRVNRQLKGFAAKRLTRGERLLHRDISLGREANPLPVVNDADDENYPQDFQYVTENVETTPMNVNRVITSLQSCRCKDDCSSMFCVCSRNSVRCWFDKEGHLVKEFNQLEPPLIFECNRSCRCWANCQNRVVQMGITCRLQVFRTVGRGWGVKTLLNIPQGTFVCEYIGEHLSDAEADSREDDSYLFDLDNKDSDTFCIDARRYANVARFVNHLCEPNLIPVKVFVEHQDLRFPRICFFSSREIKAGEELGFDYGEKFWIIKWKQFTCACGSPKCKYSAETIHQTIEEYNKRQLEEEAMEMD